MINRTSYHGDSIIGGRTENQDSFGIRKTSFGLLAIVCDGMGGGKGGKTASEIATNIIIDDIESSKSSDLSNAIYNAIQKGNFEVFRTQINNELLKGMGTTVALVVISDDKAFIAHVGDSRVYHIRKAEIINRTWDHSVVFQMLKDGILNDEEQARNHPRSNEITRALGLGPAIDVELNIVDYLRGDRFFLCSDGVNGELSDDEIIKLHELNASAEQIVVRSLESSNRNGLKKGGGHDNATAISIICDEGPMGSSASIKEKIGAKKNYSSVNNLFFPLFLIASSLFVLSSVYFMFFSDSVQTASPDNIQNQSVIQNLEIRIQSLADSLEETTKLLKTTLNKLNREEANDIMPDSINLDSIANQ